MINLSSYKDIAKKLGITPEAISARLRRRNLSHLVIEKRGKKKSQ